MCTGCDVRTPIGPETNGDGQVKIMTNETWGKIREELQQHIGKNNYVTWIEPLQLSGLKNGVARFEVPTVFFGDWVSRNFADHIRNHLNTAGAEVERVEFAVNKTVHTITKPGEPVKRAPRPAAKVRNGADDDLPGAPLDARFTFDSFVVGKPNELAHAAARRVAEGGPVTFNPLFLYGGVGLGKTHLMHAIAHELQTRKPEAARALSVRRTVHVSLRSGAARTSDHGFQGTVPFRRRADGR